MIVSCFRILYRKSSPSILPDCVQAQAGPIHHAYQFAGLRQCLTSGGQSPATHRGGPGSNPETNHVGSVVDGAALGQVSSEYFSLPCHSFIPLIAPQSSFRVGTIGQQTVSVTVD
jgi:hypothetical protein